MMGLTRRTVTEWFKCQSKFKIMWNSHRDRFEIRDVINDLAVGGFMYWDDAAEWCYKFHTDRLHDE